MRLALLLAIFSSVTALDRTGSRLSSEPLCRAPFEYYNGWCVYTTVPTEHSYQESVDICQGIQYRNAYAPSIHSQDELDFWSKAAVDITSSHGGTDQYFWLDAYCAKAGDPYKWRDGTPTDYLGPNNELQQCDISRGIILAPFGISWNFNGTTNYENTLCVTKPNDYKDASSDYCACNPSMIYLDIVFVVDTSDSMKSNSIGDITATIQSTLYPLTFGTELFQSNVAIIAYAESVQTVVDFGGLRSTNDINRISLPLLGGNPSKLEEAIKQASSMLSSVSRNYTREVIVLIANDFEFDLLSDNYESVIATADTFKNSNGIIITLDYNEETGMQGLLDISTPGFYMNDLSENNNLDADVLYALCDGCYHISTFSSVYDAADNNCRSMNGFVATVHDDDKNMFLLSTFPPQSRYWLGLRRNGTTFEWADGYPYNSVYWAPGNPAASMDCVYGQQQTGFKSSWFSAPCTDPLKNSLLYACQLRPCDSAYNCWA